MSLACAKCGKNTWTCGCFLVHELLNSQPSAENSGVTQADLLSVVSDRVCAMCLQPIVRADYDTHMQDAHGFETIHLEFVKDGSSP